MRKDYPGKDRVPRSDPNLREEMTDPDFLYRPDKYDADYIWDGETVDEDKT